MSTNRDSLCEQAIRVREHAYAPYSHYHVGAALLCADGQVVVGVNMENPSYGLTLCAERVAMGTAISRGVRPGEIRAVAIAATGEHVSPCGACRQVLAHFCQQDALLWCCSLPAASILEYRVHDMLPHAFALDPELSRAP